jgi:hypothetical protein
MLVERYVHRAAAGTFIAIRHEFHPPAYQSMLTHNDYKANYDFVVKPGGDHRRRKENLLQLVTYSSHMPKLLSVKEMPKIDGIVIPHDLYVVMKEPAPMAGMYFPRGRTPWKNLSSAGSGSIVCLVDQQVFYNPLPLKAHPSSCLQAIL